jgi:hypothetical protein
MASPTGAPPLDPLNAGSAEAVIRPLVESSGWLKFIGVMSIVSGALYALSCYGIVVAWLPIWIGVLVVQGADRLRIGADMGDHAMQAAGAQKLKLAITIWGILMIIGLVLTVLMIVGMIMMFMAAGAAGMSQTGGY